MSVLRPSPGEAKISQETKRPCHSRISVCAHRAWCVRPPPWWRWRQRPTKRIWQGGEVFLAARRPRRMRKVVACSVSISFSLLLVSSSIVLDEDRPPQRDCCASAAAPLLLRLAAHLSRLMLASLAPSLGVFQRHALYQVVFVFGRRRPGRPAACRLLSAVA